MERMLYRQANHIVQLDKLEWVWNMKHGTLDVDTPRNIHPREYYYTYVLDRPGLTWQS